MGHLSLNVNADKVLKACQEHHAKHGTTNVNSLLGREHPDQMDAGRFDTTPIPKHAIPSKGCAPDVAYRLIHDELELDGNPLLNLASFVHTWQDPEGTKLVFENISKNLIDSDEYPSVTLLHSRVVSMIAKLWHSPEKLEGVGTCTTGSSEAIQLGGLAMKKTWQKKRQAAGKDYFHPNIVMGANAQVALEKFARYFDVEMRLVPVDESTQYCMSPERAMQYVDENTIGVFVILGSTYTGIYEDVVGMSKCLDEYEKKTGQFVPIHVDAASGGFVAPFATPQHVWDFKLPRVVSINSSCHKFGGCYVGCGIVVWRDKQHLPEELIFKLTYLGSVEYSFSLNFSRPAAPIIGMYYNLVQKGFDGYRRVALNDLKNARLLSRALEKSTYYKVVSTCHLPISKETSVIDTAKKAIGAIDDVELYVPSLPVVAFKFSEAFEKEYPSIRQAKIQTYLRAKGWIVPNYELPPNVSDQQVLRVVVREQFNEDLVERLVTDLVEITENLMKEAKETQGTAGAPSEHDRHVRHRKHMPAHGRAERLAASHGGKDVKKPVGHDSVC